MWGGEKTQNDKTTKRQNHKSEFASTTKKSLFWFITLIA